MLVFLSSSSQPTFDNSTIKCARTATRIKLVSEQSDPVKEHHVYGPDSIIIQEVWRGPYFIGRSPGFKEEEDG